MMDANTDLSGVDLRRHEYRRETFQRFYTFTLTYGIHPGCVYQLLPQLAVRLGWTPEQRGWAALLNGHTQNPVTTLLLMDVAPTPADWPAAVELWRSGYDRLAWDTDRRYSKAKFGDAIPAALEQIGPDIAAWWGSHPSWDALWTALSNLPTFGRLSTWSCAEYGWLLGLHPHDASTFMLADPGSRSHRLGTAWVFGMEQFDPHPSNPLATGEPWPDGLTDYLDSLLEDELLPEAQDRNPGWMPVTRLTMESALCTYKSWHRPRRRYTGVYADMLHDRIHHAQERWDRDLSILWDIRRDTTPDYLRLEATPGDPGTVPIKQDWYRLTGRPPILDHMFPDLESGWTTAVETGELASQRRSRP